METFGFALNSGCLDRGPDIYSSLMAVMKAQCLKAMGSRMLANLRVHRAL